MISIRVKQHRAFRAEKRNKHARTFTGGRAQGLKEMAEIRFSIFRKVGRLPPLHQ